MTFITLVSMIQSITLGSLLERVGKKGSNDNLLTARLLGGGVNMKRLLLTNTNLSRATVIKILLQSPVVLC